MTQSVTQSLRQPLAQLLAQPETRTLTIVSGGNEVDYEFYTSGKISPKGTLNANDTIDHNGHHLHGHCQGWHDTFTFTGAPMNFVVNAGYDDLRILVDGDRKLPAHLKMHVAVVENEHDQLAAYEISSSRMMVKRGLADKGDTRVSGNDFEGFLDGKGKDKFAFQGTFTGWWCNHGLKLTVDGVERDIEGTPPQGSFI